VEAMRKMGGPEKDKHERWLFGKKQRTMKKGCRFHEEEQNMKKTDHEVISHAAVVPRECH